MMNNQQNNLDAGQTSLAASAMQLKQKLLQRKLQRAAQQSQTAVQHSQPAVQQSQTVTQQPQPTAQQTTAVAVQNNTVKFDVQQPADNKALLIDNSAFQANQQKPESDTFQNTLAIANTMSVLSAYSGEKAPQNLQNDVQELQNTVQEMQSRPVFTAKDRDIYNSNAAKNDLAFKNIQMNLQGFHMLLTTAANGIDKLTTEVNTLKQQKQVAQTLVLSDQQLKALAERFAALVQPAVQPAQQPAANTEDLKNHLNLQLAPITQLVTQQNQQIDQQGKQIEQLTQQLNRQSEQSAQLVQYITQLSQQVNISAPTHDSLTLSLSQSTAHGRSKSQPARSVNTSFQSEQHFARQSSTLNQSLPQVSSASYHEPVNEPVGSQFLKSQAYPTSTEQQQAQEQRSDNLLNSDKYPAPEQPKNGAQNLLDSAAYNNAQQPAKQKINTQQLIKDLDAVAADTDIAANQQLGNAYMLSSGAYAEPQKPAAKQPQAKKNAFHTLFAKKQQPQANFDDDVNHVRPRQVKVQAFSFENRQNSTLQIMAEQCVVL